ncbi:hypothetical protein [Magnetospirillum molischianum]|uniref:Uncharacterized protein n=1 Tax=Magnetospirillum molischianum DSM 120 TaxID=1150626 RepID=H8FRJ4_MAGML|nr:hypothetical protein [Magnetospirillum molischianum]CCG40982.1 conserved hypothetical protein [Magnetospirillum molischianum DSM 120]
MSDEWENGGPGLFDALAAARRIAKVNSLTRVLRGLDPMTAAKKGVAPSELDAIMNMRLSELDPTRLDHLAETLLKEPERP